VKVTAFDPSLGFIIVPARIRGPLGMAPLANNLITSRYSLATIVDSST
jgi:hypothetical protein